MRIEEAGFCVAGPTQALLSYCSGHGYPNGTYRAGDETQRRGIYLARAALS